MRAVMAVMAMGVLVAGCATEVVSSSARTVVVRGPDGATAQAQKLADVECAKHGRHGRLVDRPSRTSAEFVFDCVQ